MATASLKVGKIDLFRLGYLEAHYPAGLFEGMGTVALPWLQRGQRRLGLPPPWKCTPRR
jgi:chorismate mutase